VNGPRAGSTGPRPVYVLQAPDGRDDASAEPYDGVLMPPASHGPSPSELASELATIDPALRERLARSGLNPSRLIELARTLVASPGESPEARRDRRNRLTEDVRPPARDELLEVPQRGSPDAARLGALGNEALQRGELAFAVLAGGMATRMGGVVKALVDVFPGQTFLDLRLAENRAASDRAGRAIPLWLMTSTPPRGRSSKRSARARRRPTCGRSPRTSGSV